MQLSVVTTMYRSSPYLREFHERVSKAAAQVSDDYEIVLVNDGSPDDSLQVALELQEQDPRIRIVDFSRNFGHQTAMLAGLHHARGERAFLVDSDLEEPPECLVDFWRELDADPELDVVYGIQEARKAAWWHNLTSRLFEWTFTLLSRTRLDRSSLNARLMNRRFLDALRGIREQDLFLVGIFSHLGFRQRGVVIQKAYKGVSSYTLRKRLRLAVTSITSFSSVPLQMSFYCGFVVALGALLASCWILYRVLFGGADYDPGWPSLIVSIWFLSGVILMAIGMLGIYVSRIYREVKARPPYIVRQVYEKPAGGSVSAAGRARTAAGGP